MRKDQCIRLTKVPLNGNDPAIPAVGQFDGTVDTPLTESVSTRQRKNGRWNLPNEHSKRTKTDTDNHLFGL